MVFFNLIVYRIQGTNETHILDIVSTHTRFPRRTVFTNHNKFSMRSIYILTIAIKFKFSSTMI